MIQITKKAASVFAVIALAVTSFGYAGTTVKSSGKAAKDLVEETKKSWITGDIGVGIWSQYITRGAIQENQGAIIQPYADLYFKLYEGDGFLNSISLNLGIWNSFHSRHTFEGATSGAASVSTPAWYEFDFLSGVSFTFAKHFTFTPSYYAYLSPNDGFATFHGLNLNLAIDDSEWLGAFSLKPSITVLFELEGKAASGPASDNGVYYELALNPGAAITDSLSINFPITAGFGSGGFYAHDGFGYASVGANLTYALKFIPEQLGTWTVNTMVQYYYLNDTLDDYNAGVIVDRNNSDWVFSGGIKCAF